MFVSVITATRDRSHFLKALVACYELQTYPHDSMEWILMDDGSDREKGRAIIEGCTKPNIQYVELEEPVPTGTKLNRLIGMTRGDVIVVMDDDDWYSPWRVSGAVNAFELQPGRLIAGCSKVYMQFEGEEVVSVAGPYHDRHALHCTMAFQRAYFDTHSYDGNEICAVEWILTNGFTEPMIQLNPRKTILHRVHGGNTFQGKRSIGLLRKTKELCTAFMA